VLGLGTGYMVWGVGTGSRVKGMGCRVHGKQGIRYRVWVTHEALVVKIDERVVLTRHVRHLERAEG